MCGKLGYLPLLLLALSYLFKSTAAEAVAIDTNNLQPIAYSNELLVLLFYSERCKFSTQFLPIFDATADRLKLEYGDTGKVALGKVDCLSQHKWSSRFDIRKYPTVKIIRLGFISKTEYRGQRSVEALLQFVENELKEPIKEFKSLRKIQMEDNNKYLIIGYFKHKDQLEYQIYRRASISMKDVCQFHVSFNSNSTDNDTITFRRDLKKDSIHTPVMYSGNMTNINDLIVWIENKCARVVRELTFENAEEIGEEGRPLLILFHSRTDSKSREQFENIVETQLIEDLHAVNFLTADGERFAHPLYHMGKSETDLPLIAVDSFDHMYMFPNYHDILKPGELKQFISQLLSGQLHNDSLKEIDLDSNSDEDDELFNLENWQNDIANDNKDQPDPNLKFASIYFDYLDEKTTKKTIPQSKFKELLPSKLRYTFVKDEL